MSAQVEFKKIIITDARQIVPMGGITGPVNTPIMQPTRKILELLQHGLTVIEVADDGSQNPLTFANYNLLFDAVEALVVEEVIEAEEVIQTEETGEEVIQTEETGEEVIQTEETGEEVKTEEVLEEKAEEVITIQAATPAAPYKKKR